MEHDTFRLAGLAFMFSSSILLQILVTSATVSLSFFNAYYALTVPDMYSMALTIEQSRSFITLEQT